MTRGDPQEVYARWLASLSILAFVSAGAAALLYLGGMLQPYIDSQALLELWRLPLDEYLARTGAPTGWAWLSLVGRADYLGVAVICLFGLISLVCCARVIPAFLRQGERLHAGLAMAQVLVLLAAALNLFPGAR